MKLRLLAVAAAASTLFVAFGSAHAQSNCDTLRAEIEAKIAASGVTNFSVLTVDAAATASGQIVGSCDLGTKKIVYQREGGTASPPPASTSAPAPRGEPLLTECKDGSVSMGGTCKP
ncbi:DUF1161 domain-containing protein [Variovorax sp. EBFNA2]|uniref:DUF1161 domain-containing protein n=1 Tax=Variovorax sp. EBFNA2 TaxID=3342097 RepID=UPI0029C0084A|nr:DUF1161 domain-containing protein [Variovorax boronicumulans]WPG36563.1 DUF1161 domain-containing protein [Variovorax boronicumulans]